MTDIKVRAVRIFDGCDGRQGFNILAHAEILLPAIGISFQSVTLAWSEARGYTAIAPRARNERGLRVVLWSAESQFARDAARAILSVYEGMGGALPSSTPAKAENRSNAARRVAERKERRDHVTGKPIGEDPFDAVDETCERAGLDRVLGVPAGNAEAADAQIAA